MNFERCLEGLDDQCPNSHPSTVVIGRTEFNVLMYDSLSGGRWNISYFDYTSNGMGKASTVDKGTEKSILFIHQASFDFLSFQSCFTSVIATSVA